MIAILIGPAATVATSLVTVLLLCGWIVLLKIICPERTAQSDAPCQPPMVSGLPVVGSALALGRGGATYLQACRARHGDTFTLRLPGQRMTFLLSPHSIPFFFKAPDSLLSFAPAVEQFTFRVFGLPPCDFLPKHHLLMDTLRGQVGTRDALPQHASRLLSLVLRDMHTFATSAQCLHNDACSSVSDNTGRVVDLFEAVKAFLFPVAVESLFGAAFVHRHGASALQDAFFALDEGFEMAASPIPHILQPSFCKAKRYLIEALR
jgi:cytochrome P450